MSRRLAAAAVAIAFVAGVAAAEAILARGTAQNARCPVCRGPTNSDGECILTVERGGGLR